MPKPKYDIKALADEYEKKVSQMDSQITSKPTPTSPSYKQRSPLQSGLIGMAQGATFGFGDEAVARLESIRSGRPYEEVLKESKAMFRGASEQNPVSYIGGEIAGGIAPALIPTGATQATAGARIAAKLAASTPSQALKGAGIGALAGLGYSEGETAGEIARDVGIGGALGGVLGGAFPFIKSKILPKKLKSSITNEANETVTEQASQRTGEEITDATLQQEANRTGIPLKELEESLKNAQSAAEEGLSKNIFLADEVISTLTRKPSTLINYLRKNPEQSKQIAEIANTSQSVDDLARQLTEYATANPTKRQGIEAAIKGRKILQDSNILVSNEDIFNILDKSRNRIIENNKLGISSSLNLAQKEIDDISEKIIAKPTYDGIELRKLLKNLDDQVNKYGGYYDITKKNMDVQNELKKVRGEINNYIKTKLPEDVRGEYDKQYKLASQKLNQAENIESMLTSKRASMKAKGTNIGDLEKANTILNRYISRPTAGKQQDITYLTELLQEQKPSFNLKDELDKIRIKKQIEASGAKGSNVVNTFVGMADVDLPIEFPGSKLFTSPINRLLKNEAAYIGARMEDKGGKLAQEWADYSGELMRQGKEPTQTDAYKFILAQSSKVMDPGFRRTIAGKFGANLPEEAIPNPIPPTGSPIPSQSPQSTQRGFATQQGIQRGLLDQFLLENKMEKQRREANENNFQNKVQNRVTK
jgi:hypothetical protein